MGLLIDRSDLRLRDLHDSMMGNMCLALLSYVWADPPIESIKCEWPATWWQHVKQRWAPRWCLKRWPVRMEHRIMEAQHYYPNLPQTCPENTAHIRMNVREPMGE